MLSLARTARTRPLGVLHPSFRLLRLLQDSLLEKLPADAHLRASGRLCVSLTRLADGRNLLVSQFDSREELVQVENPTRAALPVPVPVQPVRCGQQVLLCSCFFPGYCGFKPPSYRGEVSPLLLPAPQTGSAGPWTEGTGLHPQLFLDGALSNNMPLWEQSNTITMAPFAGESDICPKDNSFNPVLVHCWSLSVQVSSRNVHRVCTSFLPPHVQVSPAAGDT